MNVDYDSFIKSTGAMVEAALLEEVTLPGSMGSLPDLAMLKLDATALLAVLSSHIPDPEIRQHALALLLCDANGTLQAMTKSRADLIALLLDAMVLLDAKLRENADTKDPLTGLNAVCMMQPDEDVVICQFGMAGVAARSGGDSALPKDGNN